MVYAVNRNGRRQSFIHARASIESKSEYLAVRTNTSVAFLHRVPEPEFGRGSIGKFSGRESATLKELYEIDALGKSKIDMH
jgi:hypothetical protein